MSSDRPRILLALTGLRIGGGIASVSRCVARAMEERIAEGHLDRCDRVLLLEDPADPAPPPRRGEQILARGSRLRFVLRLVRTILHHRPHLVFVDLVGLARPLRILGPRPPRYAIFAHGTEVAASALGPRRGVLNGAWRILTNSNFTARRLAAEFPHLAPRIFPTLLCIDPERIAAWEANAPEEPPDRESAVLIVGRLWSSEGGKGHDELLDGWPRLLRAHPNCRLWVAGEGDDRPRLEARARALGIADSVKFLGRVPDDELARLYRTASLFAMPSRQEGFGLVYAEAMWHGLPCVGSTADAATEVILDGETGVLVPYGDADTLATVLIELLADPARLARLGEAGARRARRQFTYPRFRKDLLQALDLS